MHAVTGTSRASSTQPAAGSEVWNGIATADLARLASARLQASALARLDSMISQMDDPKSQQLESPPAAGITILDADPHDDHQSHHVTVDRLLHCWV